MFFGLEIGDYFSEMGTALVGQLHVDETAFAAAQTLSVPLYGCIVCDIQLLDKILGFYSALNLYKQTIKLFCIFGSERWRICADQKFR